MGSIPDVTLPVVWCIYPIDLGVVSGVNVGRHAIWNWLSVNVGPEFIGYFRNGWVSKPRMPERGASFATKHS